MTVYTQKAKEILKDGSFTLVLSDGEKVLTSHDRGVKPLLELLEKGGDYSSFSAADKVVGSAAAYLYVLLKLRAVYALTMSEKAKAVFEKYGIIFEAECIVPAIINRKGDGFCPMEQAVAGAVSPEDALVRIKDALKALK